MARARNIKPSIFKNEILGVADPLLTLLFESLWMLADREGRLEDRPMRIKAETFPYREGLDINGYLTELQRLGFIVRYVVGEQALIQVVNFKKHQTPHSTEKPSDLPPIEAGIVERRASPAASVKPPLNNGEVTQELPPDSLLLIPDSLIPDSLIQPPLPPSTPEPPKTAKPQIAAVGSSSACENQFELFWKAYPKKTGKEDARRVWMKLKINSALTQSILKALAWQTESDQWRKDGGQYIPNPSTYLNQGRWQDEPPPTRGNRLTPIGRKSAEATTRWLESQEVRHEKHG